MLKIASRIGARTRVCTSRAVNRSYCSTGTILASMVQQDNQPGARRGAFILFEGVDRCGKTTQTAKLADALRESGILVQSWNFPDRKSAQTGHQINEYLAKRLDLDDQTVHQLFSDNRREKEQELVAALEAGTTLVVDRYAYSGVAYSAAKGVAGLDIAACMKPDDHLPAPDLVIYLNLSNEMAAARAGFGGERYEKEEFQNKVRQVFRQLQGLTQQQEWFVVDASLPIDDIHKQIVERVLDTIKQCQEGQPIKQLWSFTSYPPLHPQQTGSQ